MMELLALDVCVARCALWGPSFCAGRIGAGRMLLGVLCGARVCAGRIGAGHIGAGSIGEMYCVDLLVLMVFGLLVIETYAMLVTLGCDVTVHSPWWQTPLPTV